MSQTVEQQGSEYPVNPDFDPIDPVYLADPYPYFARFRSETPVLYALKIDFWVVSRYEYIQNIVKDSKTFSNARVQEPLQPLTPEALETREAGVRITPTTSTADRSPALAQAHPQARSKGVLGQARRRPRRPHPRDSQRPDR
jgi:cytochrome P450